jgi:hypothetical protein
MANGGSLTLLMTPAKGAGRILRMIVDRFSMSHSTRSRESVACFELAVTGVAAHRPGVADALSAALAADPGLVAAHALKGFAQLMLARAETLESARREWLAARAALVRRDATLDEHVLVEALGLAVRGRGLAAADRLDDYLAEGSMSLLPFKIAQGLRFMGGDTRGMLVASNSALKAMSTEEPGYGFVLGCHAFALEEAGEYDLAELAGRVALEHEPLDAWGLHAVSHVHEMTGRYREGISWLEAARQNWTGCNNFGLHVAWHLALFHVEGGDFGRALQLYDAEVRPEPSEDFRDMANAVSFLWRMRQHGVPVGRRWDELRDIALRRRADTTLLFSSLHTLLALVATGERAAAAELARAIAARRSGLDDQGQVAGFVAADLAGVIAGEAAAPADVPRLLADMPRLGGSNAQRDVFVRTLAELAATRSDETSLRRVIAARSRLRREDRFERAVLSRLGVADRAEPQRAVA